MWIYIRNGVDVQAVWAVEIRQKEGLRTFIISLRNKEVFIHYHWLIIDTSLISNLEVYLIVIRIVVIVVTVGICIVDILS